MQKQISPLLLTVVYWFILVLIALDLDNCIYLVKDHLIPEMMLPNDFFPEVPMSRFIMLKFLGLGMDLFIAFTLFVFSRFILNVKRGSVFTADNIRYLKRFSVMLMTCALLLVLFRELNYWLIEIPLHGENLTHENRSTYVIAVVFLIFSLLIWIFANTYKVGLNLQQEKDLTI